MNNNEQDFKQEREILSPKEEKLKNRYRGTIINLRNIILAKNYEIHHLKRVLEHIEKFSRKALEEYICDICGKISKTIQGSRAHRSKYHKNIPEEEEYIPFEQTKQIEKEKTFQSDQTVP